MTNDPMWEPRRPPMWVRETLLSLVIIGSSLLPHPDPGFSPNSIATLVLVFIPLVLLPFRFRWPWPTLIACLAVLGVGSALGMTSPGIALACAVAVFRIAVKTDSRKALLTGFGAAVAIMALSLPARGGNLLDPQVLLFGVGMLLAAAAGDGTRARRAYITAVTERAERAERTKDEEARRAVTDERLRIARDLHDAVAHEIAVISLNAGVASSALEKRPEKAKESLATIRTASRTVLNEIGDLMNMLRADEEPGDVASPQLGLAQLADLAAEFRAAGLDLTLTEEGDVDRVTGTTSLVAYRVLQESLTNAHKHGAGSATANLQVTGHELGITVTNPLPIRTHPDAAGTGLGLVGLRERVSSVRGTVSAEARGGSWVVRANLPLTTGSPRIAGREG